MRSKSVREFPDWKIYTNSYLNQIMKFSANQRFCLGCFSYMGFGSLVPVEVIKSATLPPPPDICYRWRLSLSTLVRFDIYHRWHLSTTKMRWNFQPTKDVVWGVFFVHGGWISCANRGYDECQPPKEGAILRPDYVLRSMPKKILKYFRNKSVDCITKTRRTCLLATSIAFIVRNPHHKEGLHQC